MDITNFKTELLKESQNRIQRISNSVKTASTSIDYLFLKEAEARLNKISEIEKLSMAAQTGVRNIVNSTNVSFRPVDMTEDMNNVANGIHSAFQSYFKTRVANKIAKLPEQQMYFRFIYQRHLEPLEAKDKEAFKRCETSKQTFDYILKQAGINWSFSELMHDIQNIPVQSFFHTTYGGKGGGDLTNTAAIREMRRFFSAEHHKYINKPMVLNGLPVRASSNYFNYHANNPDLVKATHGEKRPRLYNKEDVWNIQSSLQLINALQKKISFGYEPNIDDIETYYLNNRNSEIKKSKIVRTKKLNSLPANEWMNYSQYNISDPEVALAIEIDKKNKNEFDNIKKYFFRVFKNPDSIGDKKTNITNLQKYNQELQGIISSQQNKTNPTNSNTQNIEWINFGKHPATGHNTIGMPIVGSGNKKYCPVLSIKQLQVLLYHCNEQYTDKVSSKVDANQFVAETYEVYQSNGWDSRVTSNEPMALIPPMRFINNVLMYDTDQCNFGHMHLTKYGDKIGIFMQKWGNRCDQLFKLIQSNKLSFSTPNAVRNSENVLDIAVKTVFSNRTGADSVLENIINKHGNRDYLTFQNEFLNKSLASLIRDTNRSLETSNKEQTTSLSPQNFELYKKVGYQCAKIFDLVSAIIRRSSVKTNDRRQDGKQEKFYGQNVSTNGSQKQIIFSVRYAYNAKFELPEQDQKTLNQQFFYHGIKPVNDDTGHILRETINPQRGTVAPEEVQKYGNITIVKNISYFIGQASSGLNYAKEIGTRSYNTWDEAKQALLNLYPEIAEDSGVTLPIINLNLNNLEEKCSKALDAFVKEAETQNVTVQLVDDLIFENTQSSQQKVPVNENNYVQEPNNQPSITQPQPVQQPSVPQQTNQQPNELIEAVPQQNNLTNNTEIAPPLPNNNKKSPKKALEMPQFITKQKGRTLFKQRPDGNTGKLRRSDVIQTLYKLADRLDKMNEHNLVNKIDQFLERLKNT